MCDVPVEIRDFLFGIVMVVFASDGVASHVFRPDRAHDMLFSTIVASLNVNCSVNCAQSCN